MATAVRAISPLRLASDGGWVGSALGNAAVVGLDASWAPVGVGGSTAALTIAKGFAKLTEGLVLGPPWTRTGAS
jgi:hypothetical protein